MKHNESTQGPNQPKPSTNSSKTFEVRPTNHFIAEAERLKKKYPNIGVDFRELCKVLKKHPIAGNDHIVGDIYKVRMPITDKRRGQSGGARVIIEVKMIDKIVYVLSVYDKSIKEDLTDKELTRLMSQEKVRQNKKKKLK